MKQQTYLCLYLVQTLVRQTLYKDFDLWHQRYSQHGSMNPLTRYCPSLTRLTTKSCLSKRRFPNPTLLSFHILSARNMATVKDSIPHIIRTAEDPRQNGVWSARLSRIEQINSKIRLIRLSLPRDGVCIFNHSHEGFSFS